MPSCDIEPPDPRAELATRNLTFDIRVRPPVLLYPYRLNSFTDCTAASFVPFLEWHMGKPTYRPRNKRRIKTHGFRTRMETKWGRASGSRLRKKGRKRRPVQLPTTTAGV